jgi:DNA-directed RNA polymerase specialized sigma24 family protein
VPADGYRRLDRASVDPARETERAETIEVAVQLLMKRLSPVERAVYVLHEALDYPFREIADVLQLSEPNGNWAAERVSIWPNNDTIRSIQQSETDC